jgi:hypothetical protein
MTKLHCHSGPGVNIRDVSSRAWLVGEMIEITVARLRIGLWRLAERMDWNDRFPRAFWHWLLRKMDLIALGTLFTTVGCIVWLGFHIFNAIMGMKNIATYMRGWKTTKVLAYCKRQHWICTTSRYGSSGWSRSSGCGWRPIYGARSRTTRRY